MAETTAYVTARFKKLHQEASLLLTETNESSRNLEAIEEELTCFMAEQNKLINLKK